MLKFILISLITTVVIYFGIALGLLFSQSPQKLVDGETLSFPSGKENSADSEVKISQYSARDGTSLYFRHYPSNPDQAPNAPLVVIIHGSGWHGGGYTKLAEIISATGEFEVALPDLRGHGPKTNTRGDVAYIGQLEDDIADLINKLKKPDQKTIVIGHSSGGGLAIRMAGGSHGKLIDKAVLLAPFLKYNAPTLREKAGGWVHTLTRRIIGLAMLNNVGITTFNHMTAIQFNFPASVKDGPMGKTATSTYSYRMNASYAPRDDNLKDIANLPPFLLMVGENDEAFIAEQYQPTMSAVSNNGSYKIMPNLSHLEIYQDDDAIGEIIEYLKN